VSVGGPNPPDVTPDLDDTEATMFSWITAPTSPVTFTYKLHVSAAEEGCKDFSGGNVFHRGRGSEIQHLIIRDPFTVQLDTHGDKLTPPRRTARLLSHRGVRFRLRWEEFACTSGWWDLCPSASSHNSARTWVRADLAFWAAASPSVGSCLLKSSTERKPS